MALLIEITANEPLYLGTVNDASNMQFLKMKQIKTIVNCTDDCPNVYEHIQEFQYIKLGKTEDMNTFVNQIDELSALILSAKTGPILFHGQNSFGKCGYILAGIFSKLSGVEPKAMVTWLQLRRPDIVLEEGMQENLDKVMPQIQQQQLDQRGLEIQAKLKSLFQNQIQCTFRCKQCRAELFRYEKLIHGLTAACSNYYVLRPDFIDEYDHDGKIMCRKCKGRVGDYKLIGAKCNCGEWIAPAYVYQKGKTEKANVNF